MSHSTQTILNPPPSLLSSGESVGAVPLPTSFLPAANLTQRVPLSPAGNAPDWGMLAEGKGQSTDDIDPGRYASSKTVPVRRALEAYSDMARNEPKIY